MFPQDAAQAIATAFWHTSIRNAAFIPLHLPQTPPCPTLFHSVGVGREGRPVRRNKNVFLEWLRDVYQRIFWFGLEGLDDDDDDYYLDEIDWLGASFPPSLPLSPLLPFPLPSHSLSAFSLPSSLSFSLPSGPGTTFS